MIRSLFQHFTFAHWQFLLLLPLLPALAWLKGRQGRKPAFLYSSLALVRGLDNASRSRAGAVLLALRWLALALFIIGLARPQLTESETSVKASGVDIVVALDLSGSMQSEDFTLNRRRVDRLVIAKDVLKKFIERRPNDRIGLVAFAGRAYIASPLTLDHDFLQANLDRLHHGMIEDSTAIGSGLSAAVNRLRDLKSKSKIVILMTDGQNNAGKITPMMAAEAAQALAVKVYTVGVGTRGVAPMPYVMFGQKMYRNVRVDIDEETLQSVSKKTGGKYYRADSTETLRAIYAEIDQLEKTDVETKKYVRRHELFLFCVLPGLVLLLAELALAHTIWRKMP
ncbi:MAG: VWA domain-containing protein [Verrucomicrobia bacterium]|nr:VWA domain-containing protein [Verrucomicrobiota bacterium]